MTAGDLGGIIGGVALVVGAVFTGLVSLHNARNTNSSADTERLAQYERWRPKVLRLVGDMRAAMAGASPPVPEPDGVDETLAFPPTKKVTPDA